MNRPAPVLTPVSTVAELDAVVHAAAAHDRYALDTEFHGERTYHPQLALIQLAWPGGLALIDPLAVDVGPLRALLASSATMVAHAGDQDLAILERACGCGPSVYFDTQIAAGFLGLGSPSLVALAERVAGVKLAKGDRLTDWTRRPLSDAQCRYAAADVEHLLEIHDELVRRLTDLQRLDWALDECDERRRRDRSRPDPRTAWWRIKGSRQLRGKARGVAQEVAAWREQTAERLDQPTRFVLSDLALAGIVQRVPMNRDELSSVRGLDGRVRDRMGAELLDAIHRGAALESRALLLPEPDPSDRTLGPAVSVVGAWLSQRAGELDLESSLLGTRADLVELLSLGTGRLAEGWRCELVGEPIRRLVAGTAALALENGGRRVALIDRDPSAG